MCLYRESFLNNESSNHNSPFDKIKAKESITLICKITALKDF